MVNVTPNLHKGPVALHESTPRVFRGSDLLPPTSDMCKDVLTGPSLGSSPIGRPLGRLVYTGSRKTFSWDKREPKHQSNPISLSPLLLLGTPYPWIPS